MLWVIDRGFGGDNNRRDSIPAYCDRINSMYLLPTLQTSFKEKETFRDNFNRLGSVTMTTPVIRQNHSYSIFHSV